MDKIKKATKSLGSLQWIAVGLVVVLAIGGTAIARMSESSAPVNTAGSIGTAPTLDSLDNVDWATLAKAETAGSVGAGGAAGGGGGGAAGGGADVLVAQY